LEARRVFIKLPENKRHYQMSYYTETAKKIGPLESPQKVERAFVRTVRHKQSRNAKYVKYATELKKILSNVKNTKVIKNADSDTLEEILHLCSEIIYYIDAFKRLPQKKARGA
jgi:hypothetical protein